MPVINTKGNCFGGVIFVNEMFCEQIGNVRDAKNTKNNKYSPATLIKEVLQIGSNQKVRFLI